MHEIIFASASSLAEAIRKKSVSSEEVVKTFIQRIESVNPKINAIVQLTADEAIAEARKADSSLARGELRGPLHGVPMTIKDSFDTAGVPTTAGTKGRNSFVPTKDASAVARMRSAGAILLGKTNLPELAFPDETDNLIYGLTRNPYDLTRTVGGSSGGEGSIIAAGGSPLGLGSDCGGSIRIPSHFCGICGLKPTSGRVSRAGHFPPSEGVMNSLWQVGPMARFVEDLILTLPIISGEDWVDPFVVDMPIGDPKSVSFKSMKLAYYTSAEDMTVTPETADVIEKVAILLSQAGMTAEKDCPDGDERSREMWLRMVAADGGASLNELLRVSGTTEIHPLLQQQLEMMKEFKMSSAEFFMFRIRLDKWRSSMISFMKKYDLIICPVISCPAPLHGFSQNYRRMPVYYFTLTANLTGWPSVAIRAGTSSEGLPIGLQVVSRPWREDVALAVAKYIESNLGGWVRPSI